MMTRPTPFHLRIAAILLIGAVAAVTTVALAAKDVDEWVTGDANCDGAVNAVDAGLTLQSSARLVDLECWQAADVDNDFRADSLDAVLMLQQEAALIDSLGVHELQLCPFGGKGTLSELEQLVDLDGDGTDELFEIRFDLEDRTEQFSLSTFNEATDTYEIVADERFIGVSSVTNVGPFTSLFLADITGDGRQEAVLCATQWGANDPFTSVAIFSYDGGEATTVFRREWNAWLLLTLEGDSVVTVTRSDWFAGNCEIITATVHDWNGTAFEEVSSKAREHFRSADCLP